MESVWWVFKQLFNKGFVYKGVKVGVSAFGSQLENVDQLIL